jgi:hypothetical protein
MKIFIKYLAAVIFTAITCFSITTCSNGDDTNTGDIKFTVGEVEIIFGDRELLNEEGLDYWPDGSIGVVKNTNGTYAFYAANGDISSSMMIGTLESPGEYNMRRMDISGVPDGYDYAAGGPVYKIDDNTLVMFYHTEYHLYDNWQTYYTEIRMAVSTTKDSDGHFIDFVDSGPILRANMTKDRFNEILLAQSPAVERGEFFCVELLGGQIVRHNDYVYLYHKDVIDRDVDSWSRDVFWASYNELAVARTRLEDLETAARGGTVPVFKKYYQNGWTEDGIGGKSSPLKEREDLLVGWPGITYNTYKNKFIMIVSENHFPPPDYAYEKCDLHIMTSDDGVNWGERRPISAPEEPRELLYVSIIDTEGNASLTTGKEFYIYYTRTELLGWDDKDVVRRKITLE